MITDEHLLDRIIESADIRSTDTVLELGSGYGEITSRLVAIARQVVTCELDSSLATETMKRIHASGFKNIDMLHGDATKVEFPTRFDVCVSNLPYGLSAPVLFRLLKHRPLWRSSVMIVQREFADALVADPGERNYSRLSMNASVFCRTERLKRINGGCFYPVPPVESALIRVTPRPVPPAFDFDEFNQLVKLCFVEKKKSVRNMFARPAILKQLESNYKSRCSFHKIPLTSAPFPRYLEAVLDHWGFADYCVKVLPPEEMERLLGMFHERGVFFSSVI